MKNDRVFERYMEGMMKPAGNRPTPHGESTCSECGTRFSAYRPSIFGRKAVVCSDQCQRARKVRRQRERRSNARSDVASGNGNEVKSQQSSERGIAPLAKRLYRRD